jgi:hypothetical protein
LLITTSSNSVSKNAISNEALLGKSSVAKQSEDSMEADSASPFLVNDESDSTGFTTSSEDSEDD